MDTNDSPRFLKRIREKKPLRTWALSVPLAVGCFYMSRALLIQHVAGAEIRVTPYVLQTETRSFDNDPDGELFSRRTLARRSDGASAIVFTDLGKIGFAAGETSRRVTLPDGSVIMLHDSISARSTSPPMSTQRLAWYKTRHLQPPQNCVFPGETLQGYEALLGQSTALVEHTSTDGYHVVYWRAPELGCENLRYRGDEKAPDGSRKLVTEMKAVTLRLEEPDPVLFDVREDYDQLKPSECLRRQTARLGIAWDKELTRMGEFLDEQNSPPPH